LGKKANNDPKIVFKIFLMFYEFGDVIDFFVTKSNFSQEQAKIQRDHSILPLFSAPASSAGAL